MNKTFTYLLAGLVAAGAIIAIAKYANPDSPDASPSPSASVSGSPKACTLEAKICPDGTAVGRVGPNCEFAPCPTPRMTSTPMSTYTPPRY